MAKGGYNGGSTIVGPASGWFSSGKGKRKPKNPDLVRDANRLAKRAEARQARKDAFFAKLQTMSVAELQAGKGSRKRAKKKP